MINRQGLKETQIPDGGARESNKGRGRFDLLPYEALEAWAIWAEQGAVKYGDRNWEKGLLVSDCINRLMRHASKAANGWTDEDHLAACIWNAAGAITMMKRRPDLNDHPWQAPPKGEETRVMYGENGEVFRISKVDTKLQYENKVEEQCIWPFSELYGLAGKLGVNFKFDPERDMIIFDSGTEFVRVGLEDAWRMKEGSEC